MRKKSLYGVMTENNFFFVFVGYFAQKAHHRQGNGVFAVFFFFFFFLPLGIERL